MNIFWSYNEQKLVSSLNSTAAVTQYDFVLRDTLPISLYVVDLKTTGNITNVPYQVTALAGDQAVKFGGKALATFATDAEFLFSQGTWTLTGTGESSVYSANVTLNTSELIAAMGTASYLDCKVEFTILHDANHELSTQCTWRIYKDVITGSEGVPTSEFSVIQQVLDDTGAQCVKIVNAAGVLVGVFKNGSPYTYISSTGFWYPLTGTIQDGIPVPAFGAGETF